MATQKAQSTLMAKLGNRLKQAVAAHKDDKTEAPEDFSRLPSGIENGEARLVDCRFDQYKKGDFKGEYFLIMAGVVKVPKFHNGQKIEGRRTQIIEPMCDTPKKSRKTVEEHIKWVLNQFRLLGINTSELGSDNLEEIAAALMQAKPKFRFRTWGGGVQKLEHQKDGKWHLVDENGADVKGRGPWANESVAKAANPYAGKPTLVNEVWLGRIDTPDDEEPGDNVVDGTAGTSSPEPESEAEPEADQGAPEAGSEDVPFGDDLDDLVADAKSENDDVKKRATQELERRAIAAGKTADEVDKANRWEDVAEWIRAANEAPAGDSGQKVPKVGDPCYYKLNGAKRQTECEVVSVSDKREIVTLRDMATKKTILNKSGKPLEVAWKDLA